MQLKSTPSTHPVSTRGKSHGQCCWRWQEGLIPSRRATLQNFPGTLNVANVGKHSHQYTRKIKYTLIFFFFYLGRHCQKSTFLKPLLSKNRDLRGKMSTVSLWWQQKGNPSGTTQTFIDKDKWVDEDIHTTERTLVNFKWPIYSYQPGRRRGQEAIYEAWNHDRSPVCVTRTDVDGRTHMYLLSTRRIWESTLHSVKLTLRTGKDGEQVAREKNLPQRYFHCYNWVI